MSGIDARGFRVPAPELPDLRDEQAELLAFWLQERGYRVTPAGSGIGDDQCKYAGADRCTVVCRTPICAHWGADMKQAGPADDPFCVVRQRALELACAMYGVRDCADDVVTCAEAFRKFLMGERDE